MSHPHKKYTPVLEGILQQVSFVHQSASAVFLRKAGMPLSRCRILLLLRETGGCTQKYLIDRTRVDQAAMTRQLAVLEAEGFVQRRDDPKNRRRTLVTPTASGLAMAGRAADTREVFLERVLAGVSEAQRVSALEVMAKILKNLDDAEVSPE